MFSLVTAFNGARIPGGSAGDAVPALGFASRLLTGDLCWPLWLNDVGGDAEVLPEAAVDAAATALDGDGFEEPTGNRKKEFNVVDLESGFLLLVKFWPGGVSMEKWRMGRNGQRVVLCTPTCAVC